MLRFYDSLFFVLFASACLLGWSQAANILCMFTSSGGSQLNVFMAVANVLIDRGHNVTIVTTIPIPSQSSSKNSFRHIYLEQSRETMSKLNQNIVETAGDGDTCKSSAMISFVEAVNLFTTIQRDALKQGKFQKFLQEDNHFDLLLLGYFHNDYIVGIAARYGCPIAVISLGLPFGPISRMIGNPEETTYVQFPLFGRSQPMSFRERMINFLWAAVEPCVHAYASSMMESYYESLFTDDFYPKYSEIIKNVSLVLYNKYFSEAPIQPLVPALIGIGGIQIKEKPDPLPSDIQAFLDSSVNGTILYNVGLRAQGSYGSYLRKDHVKTCSSVLSGLNMTTLWEWEKGEPPTTSSNIFYRRGLPIEDILAHPNVRLHITNGRPQALFAAQYFGVPVLGIPLYIDESYNLEEMVNKGFGISEDANTLTELSLQKAIDKVLGSPCYAKKVKHFSKVYRDRPITARETAAFWLEYVIRHQGAHHMQSPLVHMGFVERWNIDVIAVLLCLLYSFKKLAKLVVLCVRKGVNLRTEERVRIRKYKHL